MVNRLLGCKLSLIILNPWCRQEAKLEEEAGRGRGLSYLVLWAEQYRLRVPAWEGTGQDLQVEIT